MPAARFHGVGREVTVDAVAVPTVGPGEVRVAVRACGICGSDLHILDGSTASAPPPLVLGHEGAGVVDAVGPDTAGWAPGEPVVIAAGFGCARCPDCTSGRENWCRSLQIPGITRDGAQAGYVVVPARALVRLDERVDFPVAAVLADAVATAYHAIRRSDVRTGQTVAVFGLGGLGLSAVLLLRQLWHVRVIGVDRRAGALRRATEAGAAVTVDATGGKPAREIRSRTGEGVDVALEFVGHPAVADQAVKSLRPAGTATLVGVGPAPLALGLRQETLVRGELRVQGSFGSTRGELAELATLVGDGSLQLSAVVSHRFPLQRFAEAVDLLRTGSDDVARVVVLP
jgi:propanol-preferring alcohol dehydrogenase